MIERAQHLRQLQRLLATQPVVAILGARQVGKSTLARMIAQRHRGPTTFLDLEDPRQIAQLQNPMLVLEPLRGLVILDEIQHRPDLFPALRVLADRPRKPARFLVLGSASPELLRQSAESLAGRIAYHELPGFSLDEVGADALERLWTRGGFPRSFLASSARDSVAWRRDFVRNFLERDLPQLGLRLSATTLRRFWNMLAHSHGQLWNGAEFARAFGVAESTVRRYLDVLTATFAVRQLPPWFENLAKRQVKAPKVYLSDPGILHTLLGLDDLPSLRSHPKLGASWEGFALQSVTQHLGAHDGQCYFWRTHQGAELDLLVVDGRRRLGFEFKYTDAPKLTPSMRTAMTDLNLTSLHVIHAGPHSFTLAEQVRAVPLQLLPTVLRPLDGGRAPRSQASHERVK